MKLILLFSCILFFLCLILLQLLYGLHNWRATDSDANIVIIVNNLYCLLFLDRFLDKMYVLSSAAAVEKFMKNPRPYLMLPQPTAPCKMVVCGPPFAGKTKLSHCLADMFPEAQVGYSLTWSKLCSMPFITRMPAIANRLHVHWCIQF